MFVKTAFEVRIVISKNKKEEKNQIKTNV